jgi:LuxR family maltose regulon positive regulatory protein
MPVPAAGLVHGWLALLHYQRHEIESAQQHLDIVWPAAEQMGDRRVSVLASLYQALLDQSRGDFQAAENGFQRAERIACEHGGADEILSEWLFYRGGFYLEQGELQAVLSLLSEQGIRPADLDAPHAPGLEANLGWYLILARALLAQGLPDRATALLKRIRAIAEDHSNMPVYLEALILQAGIAAHPERRGGDETALLYLQQALDLAAPEGYVRPFLSAGQLLVRPLRQAILRGIHPAYAQKLLAAISDQEHRGGVQRSAAGAPGSSELLETLTERETQVLRLLAAGLTSTEVAEELVIAVSTARSYIKSLYAKLDAHSRDEAIEKGRLYGLI